MRTPAAAEERPTRPRNDGRRERELNPARSVAIRPGLRGECRNQVSHRQDKHRQRERGADPKALGHVAQLGVLLVVRDRCHGHRFQRHAADRAIAGMVLLDFGMHRAGVNRFARCRRDPSRVTLQRHAAFRTIARLIRLHARTHRAEVLCRGRGFYRRGAVAVMRMVVLCMARCVCALLTGASWTACRRLSLPDEFLAAMLAAKVIRLSVALGSQRRRFVHRHSANRILGHRSVLHHPYRFSRNPKPGALLRPLDAPYCVPVTTRGSPAI